MFFRNYRSESSRHRGDGMAPPRWKKNATAVTRARHRGGVRITGCKNTNSPLCGLGASA